MSVPVVCTVEPNREADRVIFQFGDQSYGLPVEEAMLLANHTLAAINALRPLLASGAVGPPAPDIVQ